MLSQVWRRGVAHQVLSTMLDTSLLQASAGGSINLELLFHPASNQVQAVSCEGDMLEVAVSVRMVRCGSQGKAYSVSLDRAKPILQLQMYEDAYCCGRWLQASGGGEEFMDAEPHSSWKVGLTIAMQQAAAMGGSLTVEVLPESLPSFSSMEVRI